MVLQIAIEAGSSAPKAWIMQEKNEVTGRHPELARLTREVVGTMSTRVVQRKTGVNYTSVSQMMNGDRVGIASIVKFANGFGVDPNPFLAAVGLDAIATTTFLIDGFAQSTEIERTPEPGSERDPDELPPIIAAGFSDLAEIDKAQVALAMEGTARAFVESLKLARASSAVGGGLSPSEKWDTAVKDAATRAKLRARLDAERGDS